ncbi:unnamed protein product [Ixodes pacificus]
MLTKCALRKNGKTQDKAISKIMQDFISGSMRITIISYHYLHCRLTCINCISYA